MTQSVEKAAYNVAYRATHREQIAAYNAAYNAAHPGERAAWYAAHREEKAAYDVGYRAAYLEKARAATRAWSAAHREEKKALAHRRRGLKAGAAGAFTTGDLAARWAMYGDKCWLCGDIATATDHVKPLSKGGSNWPANLRPACGPCNSSKHDKWPFEYVAA